MVLTATDITSKWADLIDEVISGINRAANELTGGAFELDEDFELEGEAASQVPAKENVGAAEGDTRFSTKRTINRPWADQLKNHQHSDTLVAQTKPDAFLEGIKSNPMAVPVSVITKAQSGKDATHSISDDSIARIPDGMKNAPVVVDNPARNSIVYVTDIEDGGGLVTVSFLKNQTFDGDQVHKATSIHVRTEPMQMLEQLGNDATVYVRKNKLDVVPGSSLLKSGTLNATIKFIDDTVAHIPEKSNSKFSAKVTVPDTDSAGTSLSEGQRSYFADSKVRDAQGRLKVQIKNTDNLNPTKDKDVRFSRKITTFEDLRTENKELKDKLAEYQGTVRALAKAQSQAAYWEGQTQLTKEPSVRQDDVDKLARRIIKSYDSKRADDNIFIEHDTIGNILMEIFR